MAPRSVFRGTFRQCNAVAPTQSAVLRGKVPRKRQCAKILEAGRRPVLRNNYVRPAMSLKMQDAWSCTQAAKYLLRRIKVEEPNCSCN